jgi:hypothetical protein
MKWVGGNEGVTKYWSKVTTVLSYIADNDKNTNKTIIPKVNIPPPPGGVHPKI